MLLHRSNLESDDSRAVHFDNWEREVLKLRRATSAKAFGTLANALPEEMLGRSPRMGVFVSETFQGCSQWMCTPPQLGASTLVLEQHPPEGEGDLSILRLAAPVLNREPLSTLRRRLALALREPPLLRVRGGTQRCGPWLVGGWFGGLRSRVLIWFFSRLLAQQGSTVNVGEPWSKVN